MYLSTEQLTFSNLNRAINRHKVRSLLEKGSGECNEDVLLEEDELLGVFDGATNRENPLDEHDWQSFVRLYFAWVVFRLSAIMSGSSNSSIRIVVNTPALRFMTTSPQWQSVADNLVVGQINFPENRCPAELGSYFLNIPRIRRR